MYELTLQLVGKDTRWNFSKREIRIGRDPNCDLVLSTNEFPMVSRSHLLIRQAAERYWAEDLNTPGGTFVNGERIQVSPLAQEDVLRLGSDGPQLRVSIGTSRASSGQDAPVRRPSFSDEAPTKFRDAAPVKTSEEAPTNSRGTFVDNELEATPMGRRIDQEMAEGAVSISPNESAPDQKTPVPPAAPAASRDLETPGSVLRGAFSGLSSAESTATREDLAKTPSVAQAAGDSPVASDGRVSPLDTAILVKRLNTMRNIVILLFILVLILGGMVLYQMRMIK